MKAPSTPHRAKRTPSGLTLGVRLLHGLAHVAAMLLFWRRIAHAIAQIETMFDLWRTGPFQIPVAPQIGRAHV